MKEITKEELEYPEKIFKYRDWTNSFHQKILTENEVFMSSPKLFNDPFDCRITTNFSLLDTSEKKKAYVDYLFNKHKFDVDMSDDDKQSVYRDNG